MNDSESDSSLASALTLSDRGLVLEAIELAARAVESRPSDPHPRLLRARFHLQRRNYALALADLDAAKRLAPGASAPALARAELFCLIDRAADAEAELDEAARTAPKDEDLRVALAGVLVLRGRAARARAVIAGLLKSSSPRARRGTLPPGRARLQAAAARARRLGLPRADEGTARKRPDLDARALLLDGVARRRPGLPPEDTHEIP